tara:strand:- start:39105 stop:39272 length:168 start_codon:yes stop_codon:yes gene_type:complete
MEPRNDKKKTKHIAIRDAQIGTDKKGKTRFDIKAGDSLNLSKEQVDSYKLQKIIN